MSDVRIPGRREYTCPGCKKRVYAHRLGESMTCIVTDDIEGKHDHDGCKYSGPVPTPYEKNPR